MKRMFALSAVSLAAMSVAISVEAREPRNIGSVAAANEEVLGTPPQQDPRRLHLGNDLFEQERVETSPVGAGQFMFLDQTSLTVWPESDIVLDKYLYDPDKQAGQMALSATRGVLRFIGGKISKKTDVTITTPHAVVAIRGGMAQIEITATGTTATNIASEYVTVTNADGSVTLSRPMAQAEAGDGAPVFLGIGGPEAAAALYRRPLGIGNGGVQAPVSSSAIEAASKGVNIASLGSGDRTAPRKAPISTRGERNPGDVDQNDDLQFDEFEKTVIDANRDDPDPAAPPIGRVDGPPKPNVDPRPAVQPPVPQTRPPPPPPPRFDSQGLPLGPLPDFRGKTVTNVGPSGQGDLFAGDNGEEIVFDAASRQLNEGAQPTVTVKSGNAASTFTETPGFNTTPGGGEINGAPADLMSFVDPGVFYLNALSADDGQNQALRLGFTGEKTDRSVWEAAEEPAPTVRRYDVSNNLFSDKAGFLPASFAEAGAASVLDAPLGQLLLIGDPNGPVTPAFDPLKGPDVETSSKWGLGWLAIEGEGAEQSFAFGAMTAEALPSETGAPTASGNLQLAAKLGGASTPSFGTLPFGTFDDGAGQTAFGADGEYFVFVNGGQYAGDDAPDFDPGVAELSQWSETEDTTDSFGEARLATLDRTDTLDPEGRAPAAQDNKFTGGFAIAQGQAFRPSVAGDAPLDAPYLLKTISPTGVTFGFDPDANAVTAEFSNMLRSGLATDQILVNLNFGGNDGQSAFADDRTFFAQDSLSANGGLTGRPQSHSGRSGVADASDSRQNAFRGALAVSDAVGDGGIFPAGVQARPEYLRWGWWIGEFRHDENDSNSEFAGRTDRFIGGAWVTGVISDIASVRAQSGTATYSGFAVANVIERAGASRVSYIDGGSFDMSYNFGDRTGTLALNGIAGENLTSSVSEVRARNGHHFSGALTGFQRLGRGNIDGAFFTGDNDPTAATAGNFEYQALTNSGKLNTVVGVFGADRE